MSENVIKSCTKCLKELPESDFWMRDGGRRQSRCRFCMASERRAYYRAYDESDRERRREWTKADYRRHRELRIAQMRARKDQKDRARMDLRNAVRRGDIQKPESCSRCGSSEPRIEAHHPNHEDPLRIEWLCSPCHGLTRRMA